MIFFIGLHSQPLNRHHRAGAQRRDPVIHVCLTAGKKVDCRVKPGNDE